MIKKFISIKSVGRFKNSAAQSNPQLKKYSLILGANGYGKTTLCAILRSLQTGESSYVIGRRTLGVTDLQFIEFLLETGPVRFDGANWNGILPNLAIFDGTFVAENVHSGEIVGIDHKRNLYGIIIGKKGVNLAKEDARLAAESRAKTSDITAVERMIQLHVPTSLSLEEFLALPVDTDIDTKITEQKHILEAVSQAIQIQAKSVLLEITLPVFPIELTELLGRTIDDIAVDAERQVIDHLAKHGIEAKGQTWLADGMAHALGNTCPFCDQDIQNLPLIAAYRSVFSIDYKNFQGEVVKLQEKISQVFGDGTVGKLETLAEQNRGSVEFWSRFCSFDATSLSMPTTVSETVKTLRQATLSLLIRKTNSLLEPVTLDDTFNIAFDAYNRNQAAVNITNAAIRAVNAIIATKKAEIGVANFKMAEAELVRRKAIKKRHDGVIAQNCTDYYRLISQKEAIDKAKKVARDKLEAHSKMVVKPFEQLINNYLANFNADFSLIETKHSYPGGVATSSYQLVVNNIPIDVGDGSTPLNKPSFKNTLSSGDRATLALAFFLSNLDRDADRAQKIVVFDDPFNSQDTFRRRQTVHEIKKVGSDCVQVIVLSHDATFLKQVWDKVSAHERISLNIVDHRAQGSKIILGDIEKACQGRTSADIDELQSFVTSGDGIPVDLIRKIRGVLETYCWTTYPTIFQPKQDWLGEIVGKIGSGGESHPAKTLYDELDQINSYTCQYYHGEDMTEVTPDTIDPTELTGYAKRTLKIVNALQA